MEMDFLMNFGRVFVIFNEVIGPGYYRCFFLLKGSVLEALSAEAINSQNVKECRKSGQRVEGEWRNCGGRVDRPYICPEDTIHMPYTQHTLGIHYAGVVSFLNDRLEGPLCILWGWRILL